MGFCDILSVRLQIYTDQTGLSAMRLLALGLLARLVDAHSHRERFAAAAEARAAHGRGAKIIQAGRNAHVGVGRADAVGGIETNPAKVLDIGFRPGVSSLLCCNAVAPMKMTPDVARRNFERPNCRYKNVGKILANATADRKSLPRCGSGVGGISIEGH